MAELLRLDVAPAHYLHELIAALCRHAQAGRAVVMRPGEQNRVEILAAYPPLGGAGAGVDWIAPAVDAALGAPPPGPPPAVRGVPRGRSARLALDDALFVGLDYLDDLVVRREVKHRLNRPCWLLKKAHLPRVGTRRRWIARGTHPEGWVLAVRQAHGPEQSRGVRRTSSASGPTKGGYPGSGYPPGGWVVPPCPSTALGVLSPSTLLGTLSPSKGLSKNIWALLSGLGEGGFLGIL